MQRHDLILHVSAQCGMSVTQARKAVDCMTDAISGQLLAKQVVIIRKFGMFSLRNGNKVHFKPYFKTQDSGK